MHCSQYDFFSTHFAMSKASKLFNTFSDAQWAAFQHIASDLLEFTFLVEGNPFPYTLWCNQAWGPLVKGALPTTLYISPLCYISEACQELFLPTHCSKVFSR